MTEGSTFDAFLLTREWQDSRANDKRSNNSNHDGGKVVLWAHSASGPLQIVCTHIQPVCFIQRKTALEPNLMRLVSERRELDLLTPAGVPVDGLYFGSLRALQDVRVECRRDGIRLYESDVRPADRHLMERFIRAGVRVTGTPIARRGYTEIVNPTIKPGDYAPSFKVVSLDIETEGFDGPVLSIAVHLRRGDAIVSECVFVQTTQALPDSSLNIIPVADERALLLRLLDWLAEYDPDVVIGWNVIGFDLTALARRFAANGLAFTLGRGGRQARILPASSANSMALAIVPGRVVLDGVECLRSAFYVFEDFRLEAVAQELLGRGKLIQDEHEDRLDEIMRLYEEDPAGLAEYNIEDCRLVADIFAVTDLVQMSVSRAQLTGLALGRHGGSSASLDNLYLPRMHRRGRVAMDVGDHAAGTGSPGGYVLDSTPGLYENVLLLDFKSLYPSIIRTFKIDPLGLWQPGEEAVEGFLGAEFARDDAILPELIASLWQARDAAKKERNGPLSQAIKIIMNSFYGVLGSHGCRFFDPRLASSITRRGHEVLKRSQEWIQAHGHQVIYGDTDSLFVLLGKQTSSVEALATGKSLATDLNDWWRDTIGTEHRLDSHLEVEFETHFERFLMPTLRGSELGSKKRYAGTISRNGKTEMVFKGLESVRTDWTPLARRFQRELYRRIFADEPFTDYVQETCNALFAGSFDDELVYRKRLRRDAADYQRNVPPQVQAARLAGQSSGWVRYAITVQGPQPAHMVTAALDYEHYRDKQLAPIADAILQFEDTSFAALTDRQLAIF